ncbi:hypothetical protein [Phaeovulum sp.]|uniref:hypothetical protein n=1 Tax=Phaeovulum sp. TaxID=2934796 RepID=UPI0039E288BD
MNTPYPNSQASSDSDLLLDVLVERIAKELNVLARHLTYVQTVLAQCQLPNETEPEVIEGLQGIDRVTQSLEDLARLMDCISNQLPVGIKADPAQIFTTLRLRDLIANLDQTSDTTPTTNEPTGNIQWF